MQLYMCMNMIPYNTEEPQRKYRLGTDYKNIPVFAAMHGPHSLVRFGPGRADRA